MNADWGIKWFEIRERMGYSDLVTMRYRRPGGEWVIKDFPHRRADGYGMIVSILEEQGLAFTPLSKPLHAPAPWLRPWLLLKGLLIHPKLSKNPWRNFQFQKEIAPADQVATRIWNREQTDAFRKRAREKGVSASFLLLSEITEWVEKNLLKPEFPKATWMCPVNLRGAFAGARLDGLYVSFAPIVFSLPLQKTEVIKAYEAFKNFLKRGHYWAFWELYLVGRYIGERGMEFLARKSERKSYWTGTFSDVGTWNDKVLCEAGFEDWEWIMAPPGSPNYPIGITTIEWCGRRMMTVKIHPSVAGKEDVRRLAERMLTEIYIN